MSLQAYDAPLNQRAAKEHAHGKYLRLGEELFAYLKDLPTKPAVRESRDSD
jgi:hypothetical protein